MFQSHTISRRIAQWVLGIVAGLVLVECLQTLMLAKDQTLFESFRVATGSGMEQGDFLLLLLTRMVAVLVFPVTYALYLFVAMKKHTMPGFAKWAWGLLLLYTVLRKAIEWQWRNVFWIFGTALCIALLVGHIALDHPEERS